MPEVGRSFRDSTRVAGANPAIWADIFASNRDAVADEIDAVVGASSDAAELIRAGDADAVARWHRAALRGSPRAARGRVVGGELHELRVVVENRPGTVAEIALALGRGRRQHRGHGARPGRRHAHRRDVAVGRRREQADRAAEVVRGLGHIGRRRRRARMSRGPVRPRGAAARDAAAAARQVDLAPGGADRRDGGGPTTAIADYLDAADTRSTLAAVAALGAEVDARARRPRRARTADRGRRAARRGAPRRPDRRRQRGHAAAAAAGLARRAARRRVDARRRRVDPPPSRRPGRRAAALMGARVSAATGACRRSRSTGARAARDRVPAPGRQRPGQVVRAARGTARRGRDHA